MWETIDLRREWLTFSWKLSIDLVGFDKSLIKSYLDSLIFTLTEIWESELAETIANSDVKLSIESPYTKRNWCNICFNETESLRKQQRWFVSSIVISIRDNKEPNKFYYVSLTFFNVKLGESDIKKIMSSLKSIDNGQIIKNERKKSSWKVKDVLCSSIDKRIFQSLCDEYIEFSINNLLDALSLLKETFTTLISTWENNIDDERIFLKIRDVENHIFELERILELLEKEKELRKK